MSPQGLRRNDQLRRGALLATAFLALGCVEGYPSEDVPSIHPAEMTQSQRLAMMNELGRRPHLSDRWTYKLADGCRLTIGQGSRFLEASIEGAAIKSVSSQDGGSYRILLAPSDRSPSDAVVALDGGKWLDLVQMRALLIQVQRACQRAG